MPVVVLVSIYFCLFCVMAFFASVVKEDPWNVPNKVERPKAKAMAAKR